MKICRREPFLKFTIVVGAVAQRSQRSEYGSFFSKIEVQGTSMKAQGTGRYQGTGMRAQGTVVEEIPFEEFLRF